MALQKSLAQNWAKVQYTSSATNVKLQSSPGKAAHFRYVSFLFLPPSMNCTILSWKKPQVWFFSERHRQTVHRIRLRWDAYGLIHQSPPRIRADASKISLLRSRLSVSGGCFWCPRWPTESAGAWAGKRREDIRMQNSNKLCRQSRSGMGSDVRKCRS